MAFKNVVKCTIWNLRYAKFRFFLPSVNAIKTFSVHNMKLEGLPRTAYLQKKDSDSSCRLTVLVEYDPLNVEKNFTFWRNIDSNISSLLSRMDIKIYDFMQKKLRKRSIDMHMCGVQSMIYKDGEPISTNLPVSYLFEEKGKYSMKILGNDYDVVCNAPWINNMCLPKKIISKSVVYPVKFEAEYLEKEKSNFMWWRSEKIAAYIKTSILHVSNWVEVGDKFCYTVRDQDVGHYLKLECIPQNETTTGPKFTVISALPVVPLRDNYYFVKTHDLTKNRLGDDKIRVLSYNLLADNYVTTKEAKIIFDYCSKDVLEKEHRYAALAWEVSDYNADLICLQEVDGCIYDSYMIGRLQNEGYSGILCSKSNDKEGTACFYNKNKFNLIDSDKFTYSQEIEVNLFLRDIWLYLQQCKCIFQKLCDLPHSLQILVLQSIWKPDHLIVLGNVHLFSQPDADLIRLIQAMMSFRLYEYVVNKLQEKRPNDKISFILCGDFNSTPECAVNELVTKGFISADHPIWSTEETQNGLSYKLPVNMASAFPDVQYTNYTKQFKGCLDYIYYQSEFLEVEKTYPLPHEKKLSEYIGLPSIHFPSDHLPLIADLHWKT